MATNEDHELYSLTNNDYLRNWVRNVVKDVLAEYFNECANNARKLDKTEEHLTLEDSMLKMTNLVVKIRRHAETIDTPEGLLAWTRRIEELKKSKDIPLPAYYHFQEIKKKVEERLGNKDG
jgi:hypothetical protein